MSRANDVVTRLALAEFAAQSVRAEAAALTWVDARGIATASVRPNGDLDLLGVVITPSDALALARFLFDTFEEASPEILSAVTGGAR